MARRIPNYAKRLGEALGSLDWPEGWTASVQTYGSLDPTVVVAREYRPTYYTNVLLYVAATDGDYLTNPRALVAEAARRFASHAVDPRFTEEARQAARDAAGILAERFELEVSA